MDEIEGIIVKEIQHGETSKIISILTKDRGIIGVMGKGAKNIKSEFRATTSKLIHGIFYMNYRENKLSILKSIDIKNNFKNIQKDINKLTYSLYILNLCEQVSKQTNDDDIFSLCIESLKQINKGLNEKTITCILELKLTESLGVLPVLDECIKCNSKEIVTFSIEKGGYICKTCYRGEQIYHEKSLKLLRMFYYVDIAKIEKLDIEDKYINEIEFILKHYYEKYTGLYLKSKKIIDIMEG